MCFGPGVATLRSEIRPKLPSCSKNEFCLALRVETVHLQEWSHGFFVIDAEVVSAFRDGPLCIDEPEQEQLVDAIFQSIVRYPCSMTDIRQGRPFASFADQMDGG